MLLVLSCVSPVPVLTLIFKLTLIPLPLLPFSLVLGIGRVEFYHANSPSPCRESV
ncbi:hypothetical protein BR93DRAFT_490281 [Coniochaeta sp. PMI_546]|nr:hypothetical protein BR93DRAFT_490281 [Coniochaeta sp. PMI_546]